MRILFVMTLAAALAGCAVRRPYAPPAVAPAVLPAIDPALVSGQPYDPRWWAQFDDPVLDALVAQALDSNHDVRIALARVDQARAIFDDSRSELAPRVTAGAAVERREQAIPGFSDERRTVNTYRAGFDAIWELDVFGRVRSTIDAAAASAGSFEATLDDIRVSVVADVARHYFQIRGLQQQLAVADRSLANQRETLRLTTVRRDAGIGEEQDVASATARVAAIEASVPPLRAGIAERQHRLAVLTGIRPDLLRADLSPRSYPPVRRALSIGDPDALLRRRPDVRAAERRLAAATAREGVAVAAQFPRITLSGFLGLLTGRGNLFARSDSAAWAVAPALSWAAFDLGSARARVRGAAAGTREAEASFEQVVLLALEETDNALVRYHEEQQRLVRLVEQARESARAAGIARVRYKEGATDFLELLDAERTELQAQDAVARAESEVYTGVVAVYKALGGVPAIKE
jgi:outer membrane protein, multidrug efflux system